MCGGLHTSKCCMEGVLLQVLGKYCLDTKSDRANVQNLQKQLIGSAQLTHSTAYSTAHMYYMIEQMKDNSLNEACQCLKRSVGDLQV